MRDLAVLAVVAALTLVALRRPDIGVLGWTWLSMMNPHRMTWSFAYDMPVAMLVGGATLVGLLFYKGPKRLPMVAPVLLLLAFDLWMVVTHFLGFNPHLAQSLAVAILKIQLMIFVTIYLLVTRWHLNAFVIVVAGSIAFFGVKGGIFTIASGGSSLVWGPLDSFLHGNNEIGVAIIMTIPLLRYLQIISPRAWMKHALTAAMLLCAAAALGTQSRGALLAITMMGMLLWWRSHHKLIVGVMLAVAAAGLLTFMPQEWEERMRTMQTYEEDLSAMQRIDVWTMTWNLAKDNPIAGGGYAIYTDHLNAIYNPNPIGGLRNAHSIYFSVLGEHGFVGLALFLGIWISMWRSCSWVRKRTGPKGELSWAFWLASMLQVSLVGYLTGGAFLYLAYADFPYNLLIMAVVLKEWVRRQLEESSKRAIVARRSGSSMVVTPNRLNTVQPFGLRK